MNQRAQSDYILQLMDDLAYILSAFAQGYGGEGKSETGLALERLRNKPPAVVDPDAFGEIVARAEEARDGHRADLIARLYDLYKLLDAGLRVEIGVPRERR